MTNLINKIICLLIVLGTAISVSAAPEAEFKKLIKSWTLNTDGSQEFHYNMELTIYSYLAMRSLYGESFIQYNPEYQTLKINSSFTKQKDGTIVKTPDNAFVEVLPRSAADAPAYNHLKEMVVVHTGLELGATIYLDYTITTKAGYLPGLDIFEPIQQASPIKEYSLSVTVPVDKDLSYSLANPQVMAKVNVEEGMRTISWKLKNVKPASLAPMQRIESGDMQYLMFPAKSAFMIVFSVFTVLLAFALVYVVIDLCYYNREKTLKYHSGRFFDMIRSDLRFEWFKQAIKNRKDKKN